MRQVFLFFSHQLTKPQQDELINKFKVNKIVYLPEKLQNIWSNISPELPSIRCYLRDILSWLKQNSNPKDLVLVQGELGAVFLTVDFCKKVGLVPIYSTTKREAVEKRLPDGTVQTKRIFAHVRFREYESRA
jgi:hypothetical protein